MQSRKESSWLTLFAALEFTENRLFSRTIVMLTEARRMSFEFRAILGEILFPILESR